jgi:hypothetical protein
VVTACSVACASSSSGPNPPTKSLAGHFVVVNPFPPPITGFALGIALSVSGTTVSGYGWHGGLGTPLTPFSVSGQFNDPAFTLTLTTQTGDPFGTLPGTVSGSTVQGIYTRALGLTPVQFTFVRTDTTATGRYTSSVTGAVTEQPAAAAGFYPTASNFLLTLAYPNRTDHLLTLSRAGGRPAAGSYPFDGGAGFAGSVIPAYVFPAQRIFAITGGTLRVDISTPYAVIGQITVQAQDMGSGATLSVTANFSAGCALQTCP